MASASAPGARTAVLADLLPRTLVTDAGAIVGIAALTGVSAQISIHTSLSPVPFTLQTFTVFVGAAALGTVRGAMSMTLYVLAGVLGVPWFANHSSGWGGPSFGYVLGFIVAACVVGPLAQMAADRHIVTTAAAMVAGNIAVYVVGTTWLAADLHISVAEALRLGARPFLATDALKAGLASLVLPAMWRMTRGHSDNDAPVRWRA